jgi:GTPase SAR1 family protein
MPYCLSLENGLEIAKIVSKDDIIYVKECSYNSPPDITTTMDNKVMILENFLRRDSKILKKDINEMVDAYKNGIRDFNSNSLHLNKLYDKSLEYVIESLKRFMNFNDKTFLYPVLSKEKSTRIFCSGSSGSGKSFYISQLIKRNFPPSQLVYLFSPIEDDVSFEGLNIFQVNLESFEEIFGNPFTIEMLDDGKNASIVIMDDIESIANSKIRKMYLDIRDQLLERGRSHSGGYGITTITVSHNPMGGNLTKSSIRESDSFILFPSSNQRDTRTLLERYSGITRDNIQEILKLNTRGVFIKKTVPSYYVAEHNIALL